MIGLKAIKEGIIPFEVGKLLNDLFEAMQTSDYSYFSYYDENDSKRYIDAAKTVIKIIKKALKEKFSINL